MSNVEKYENLVLGSGGAGKLAAWTFGQAGRQPPWLSGERFVAASTPRV